MLICDDCGKIVGPEEVAIVSESRGEFWGLPCFENMRVCPHCGGSLVEVAECAVCGGFCEEVLGLCQDCLNKLTTEETCLEIGDENLEDVRVNGFLASAFSEDEINEILLEHLRKDVLKLDKAKLEYRDYDEYYFAEWVREKWKREK